MKTALLTALLLFCLLRENTAQESAVRLEKVELPSSSPMATIECIFEDSRGFVWFGAYSGLYRFDGYDLVHYRHDPDDPNSLGDNKIKKILEDKHGNLWLGTQGGMHYFDVARHRFLNYSDSVVSGIGKTFISDMVFDGHGVLWVAGSDVLCRFEETKGRFVAQLTPSGEAVGQFLVPGKHHLYFCLPNWLYSLDASGKVVTLPLSDSSVTFTGLYSDHPNGSEGYLWVGTKSGLFRIDQDTRRVEKVPALNGIHIHKMVVKGNQRLVLTYNGVYTLNGSSLEAFGPLTLTAGGVALPLNNLFIDAHHGSGGVTWLADHLRTVYKFDANKQRFHHIPFDLMAPMKGVAYTEMYEYRPGVLLLPGKDGPSLVDVRTGAMKPFPIKPVENRENWEKGIPLCFWEDVDSRLWIGTTRGLFLVDKKNGRFLPVEKQMNGLEKLKGVTIRKIIRDRKGRLWLATWGAGLFRIDFKDKTVKQYHFDAFAKGKFTYAGRTVYESRDGTIWYGSRGGLMKYLENQDTFLLYRNIPNDPTSMSDNTVFCLYEDDAGNLWTGSYGGGLNCMNVKDGTFKHYTTDDGLINNNVFCLYPDNNGKLWMTGFNGLTVMDLKTKTFRKFNHDQGLLNLGFDAFLHGKSPYTGHLMFGGTRGIDVLHPDSFLQSRHMPRVHFTGFKLFNESVPVADSPSGENNRFYLGRDIGLTRELVLRYDQNVLTFDFAALEYSTPQTVQYAYRLEGFDTAWQYIGAKRSITFTNLDPGSYTLKVKSTNGDGLWGAPGKGNTAALELVIMPPWWKTWTFRSLVLLSIMGLVTGLYTYRVRQIRERAELNQRISQVKMEALRSQMNPHFVFNCLSSLKLFVEKNETEKASDHISKFAALLRRVLDDARTDTETVTLERELDTLRRYVELEMIRFKDKFTFRMEVDPEVELNDYEVPPLILQPYVENAILHGLQHRKGGGGLLALRVWGNENHVSVVVEDNGVGREAAREIKARHTLPQQSHGLNVTAERLNYFSKKSGTQTSVETTDLKDKEGMAAGTRVTLTFQKTQ